VLFIRKRLFLLALALFAKEEAFDADVDGFELESYTFHEFVGSGFPDESLATRAKEIEISGKNLKPCMQSIVKDLSNLKRGPIGQIMQRFSRGISGYNWVLKDDSLAGGTAQTEVSSYKASSRSITTTFDSQAWPNATDLSWARTVMHESLHGYLSLEFYTDKNEFVRKYPAMMQDFNILHEWDAVHHEEFARSFVFSIAFSLEEYGRMKGYELPKQFYEDMSWAGLKDTEAFKKLSESDQARILDTIRSELTGKDCAGNVKAPVGIDAGC
jgi:hypothetical protein